MRDKTNPLNNKILSGAATIGSMTLLSRFTGFLRDIVIAALLGAGPLMDIFVVAFRLPNLFRHLFAEGAFNAAFVPLFARQLEKKGKNEALILAAEIFSCLLTLVLIATGLAIIFMPSLIDLIAYGFRDNPEQFELAVYYGRITFPYLFCMTLMAFFTALLNAQHRFRAAAFAPVLLNIVLIIALLLAVFVQGLPLPYLIWGTVIAGIAQAGFVMIAAYRAGLWMKLIRPRITPHVKRVFALAIPGIMASGIMQINLLIGTSIATRQEGAAAWLYYADRLYQLPLGVIGAALGVALLPDLSRRLQAGDYEGARESQNNAIWAGLWLTLPAMAGLFILAEPIVSLLFERGAFTAQDVSATALAIRGYMLGLPAFVLIFCVQPAFFARENTKSPFIYSSCGILLNIILSLSFFPQYGHVAIAVATSLGVWLGLGLMILHLYRHNIWFISKDLFYKIALQIFATLIMAGLLYSYIYAYAVPTAFMSKLGIVAFLICSGAAIYFLILKLCGTSSLAQIVRTRHKNKNSKE